MSTAELLWRLVSADILLRVSADRLVIDAPAGSMTDDTRAAIRSHKPALLAALTGTGETDARPRRWPIDLAEEMRIEAADVRHRIRQSADPRARMKLAAVLAA